MYPYPSHYLYDFIVIAIATLVGRQLFHLKISIKQFIVFILVMMFCYQINFYVIEDLLGKEYKYVVLYMGMLFSYIYIMKLSLIGALIVIMTTTAMNGLWTNINIIWMLNWLFPDYDAALNAQHIQYTCYTLTTSVCNGLVIFLKVHIFDIQKYN